jgi:hypothetical protein
MAFSYIIKVADEYVKIDSSDCATISWLLSKDRKSALYMSKDFADILLEEIKITFANAQIIGINYDQN